MDKLNKYSIQGTPDLVRDQILETAKIYGTTDVSIATNCHYFQDRIRSFTLIAKAFDLPNADSLQLVPEE